MQFKGPIKHSLFISEILISFFSSFSLHRRNDTYFRRPDKYHQPPLKFYYHPQAVAHMPQASDTKIVVGVRHTGVNQEELLLEAFMAEFTVDKGQAINQPFFSLNMPIRKQIY